MKLSKIALSVMFGILLGILGINANAQFSDGIVSVVILEPSKGNQVRIGSGSSFQLGLQIECNGSDMLQVDIPALGVFKSQMISCPAYGSSSVVVYERIQVSIPANAKTGVYDITVGWGFIQQATCIFCVVVEAPLYALQLELTSKSMKTGEHIHIPVGISGPGDLDNINLEFEVSPVDTFFPGVALDSVHPQSSIQVGVFSQSGITAQAKLLDPDRAHQDSTVQTIYLLELELDTLWPGKIKLTVRPAGSTLSDSVVALSRDNGTKVFAHQIKPAVAVFEIE